MRHMLTYYVVRFGEMKLHNWGDNIMHIMQKFNGMVMVAQESRFFESRTRWKGSQTQKYAGTLFWLTIWLTLDAMQHWIYKKKEKLKFKCVVAQQSEQSNEWSHKCNKHFYIVVLSDFQKIQKCIIGNPFFSDLKSV